MKTLFATMVVGAGAIDAPAHAAPTCLLEVDGQRYLDGACDAARHADGVLVMGNRRSVSPLVRPRLGDSDHGVGAWKSNGQLQHFGPLERDGPSCWRGAR